MPTLAVNDTHLHFQERGVGDAILLIHGTATSADIWAKSGAALEELGRVISYDRRGNGRSNDPSQAAAEVRESNSVATHADDAAALLEALDAVPAIVIGRGYGGVVAVDLALRFPDRVRALVLLEPALYALSVEAAMWHMELAQATEAAAATNLRAAGSHYLAGVQGDEADDEIPAEMRETIASNGAAVLQEIQGPYALTTDTLGEITMPTLLVVSAESPDAFRLIADAMLFTMPNAQPRLVPGGHFVDPSVPSVMSFLTMVTDGTWTGPPDLTTGE